MSAEAMVEHLSAMVVFTMVDSGFVFSPKRYPPAAQSKPRQRPILSHAGSIRGLGIVCIAPGSDLTSLTRTASCLEFRGGYDYEICFIDRMPELSSLRSFGDNEASEPESKIK
jgi:hypothetical protein